MKKILPIIIAVVITAVASSGITYYITVEKLNKPADKNESSYSEDVNDESTFSRYSLEMIDESVKGSPKDNKFEIKSVVVDKDKDGKDVVLVTYVYTRLSGEPENLFGVTYNGKQVYQNGVSLADNFSLETNSPNSAYDEVQAGYSAEITEAYELKNKTTDVVVEVKDYYNESYVVSKTFKMK